MLQSPEIVSNKVRVQGFAWIFLLLLPILIGGFYGEENENDIIPGWGEPLPEMSALAEGLFCLMSCGWLFFAIWIVFIQQAQMMIITGINPLEWTEEDQRRSDSEDKRKRALEKRETERERELERERERANNPNLMTDERKSTLEELAKKVLPNPRYFTYRGETMEFTSDIGNWIYTSCNSRSTKLIDIEMVEDATRGYERKNNPPPKKKKKSYSGRCSQDAGGLIFSSECGTPTNNRCPRCNRYACGSCLGSRTYNGRKVCDGCNRSMSGD